MSTEILFVFLFSLAFLFVARKAAKRIGLVDKPNYRKRHQGLIPLVGGISVYAGLCFAFWISEQPIAHAKLYLTCAGILVFVGALDDRFDISVKIRALVQALVGIAMMVFAGLYLRSFGHVLGDWEMLLGPFGYLLTLFAVWAAINAFNMVDGIDGLLGGLSCVSFGALGLLLYLSGHHELAMWCFAMIAAILPYILLNLGVLGRRYKVFMGDAGSTLIGFTVIWILLETTQGKGPPDKPGDRAVDYRYSVNGYGGDHVSPFAQRDESLLSRPSAYSPPDHARRFYVPSGFCVDHPGGRIAGGGWRDRRTPDFYSRVGYVGIILACILPVRLLHQARLESGAVH